MRGGGLIARDRAVSYVDRYDDKSPKEALGMFCLAVCGVMRPFPPGAKPQARLPAVTRRVRVATPVLTLRTATSSTPSPLYRARCSRQFVTKWGAHVLRVRSVSREEVWASAGVQALCLRAHLLALSLVTRWPLRGKEWLNVFSFSPMYNGDSAALETSAWKRTCPPHGGAWSRRSFTAESHPSFFLAAVPRPIKFAFSR